MLAAPHSLRVALVVSLLGLAGCTQSASSSLPVEPVAAANTPLPTDDSLKTRLDKTLEFNFSKRLLNTKEQAAWQVVHGALAYGRDYEVAAEGKRVKALEYLLSGGALTGWAFRKGDHGLDSVLEAGTKTGQGHEDQWLGYLSQVDLKPEETIVVAGQDYKIQDLITQAQWDIYEGMEATWTLMAFATYLPLDARWKSKDGSEWTIDRMVKMETEKPLGDSACGGSHRMYGLAVAVNRCRKERGEVSGAYAEADKKIRDCVAKAREYQHSDGGLSTNFFERPGTAADVKLRIHSTGHTLEFLTMVMSDEELKEPWVTRATTYLLDVLEATEEFPLECGALYHAVHGLLIYRERRFGEPWVPMQGSAVGGQGAETAAVDKPGLGKTEEQPSENKPAE